MLVPYWQLNKDSWATDGRRPLWSDGLQVPGASSPQPQGAARLLLAGWAAALAAPALRNPRSGPAELSSADISSLGMGCLLLMLHLSVILPSEATGYWRAGTMVY